MFNGCVRTLIAQRSTIELTRLSVLVILLRQNCWTVDMEMAEGINQRCFFINLDSIFSETFSHSSLRWNLNSLGALQPEAHLGLIWLEWTIFSKGSLLQEHRLGRLGHPIKFLFISTNTVAMKQNLLPSWFIICAEKADTTSLVKTGKTPARTEPFVNSSVAITVFRMLRYERKCHRFIKPDHNINALCSDAIDQWTTPRDEGHNKCYHARKLPQLGLAGGAGK